MTREQVYTRQLKTLGVYEPAFDPLIKDLAKAERRRTRAEKAWAATAPPGGKPSFLDPHYQIVAQLDREILGYREVMGLTPKSLRRLRGVTDGPGEQDLIVDRLDRIAARVEQYEAPEAHSLDEAEAQAAASEQAAAWDALASELDMENREILRCAQDDAAAREILRCAQDDTKTGAQDDTDD